jgi:autotransporter adhesin
MALSPSPAVSQQSILGVIVSEASTLDAGKVLDTEEVSINGGFISNLNSTGAMSHSGDASIIGDLNVGSTTQSGDLNVNGATTFTGSTTQTGDASITGNTTQTGNIGLTGDLNVNGDSIFAGDVDISGATSINNTLDVQIGTTTLDVNGSGFNVQVGTSPNSSLDVTSTTVQLSTASGSGFAASSNTASLTGTSNAIVSGGASTINVSSSGVALAGSGGAPVRLSGVADPTSGTDAVNLRTMRRELGALESLMSSGIAQSMAMSHLPYPDAGQQYSFGYAVGGFNGEAGAAIGASMREGNMVARGSLSYSSHGTLGGALGVGWSW